MIRTPHFNFPYFQSGEIFSATVDEERAVALDLLLKGLAELVSEGIIDGWEISDEGGLDISVSPGKGFIDGFYGVTQNAVEKTLSDDITNYVYATRNANVTDGVSTSSNKAHVSFVDVEVPNTPSNFQVTSVDERVINLQWDKNTDSDISYYKIYRKISGDPSYTFLKNVDHLFSDGLTYVVSIDSGLSPETEYDYQVSAVDLSGNESAFASVSGETNPDTTPASEVTNIRMSIASEAVSFTWNESTSDDIDSYIVTLSELTAEGDVDNTITVNTGTRLYYFNNALKDNVRYRATIKTLDQYGNVSSGIVKEFTPQYNPAPSEVGVYGYTVSNIQTPEPITPQLVISWGASASSDVSHYNLYVYDKEGRVSETITVGNHLSKTLISYPAREGSVLVSKLFKDGTDYEIKLTVVDSVGNESDGIFLKASVPDYSPPPDVANVIVSSGDALISLAWEASDVKDFSYYELYYWDNATLSTFSETNTYSSFSGNTFTLPVGVVGSYPVGSWVELTAPPESGGESVKMYLATALNIGDTSVVCNFIPTYYPQDATIRITNPPAPVTFSQREHYTLSGLTNGSTYTLIFSTVDESGNKSGGITLSATPAEPVYLLDPPLAVTPKGRDREIKITWSSVDNAEGYNIYRAGPLGTFDDAAELTDFVLLAQIEGNENTTIYDIGLTNDVRYCYIVTAYLGTSESEYDDSDQVIEAPIDTYNPDPPRNLTASVAAAQVTLSWDPPADITGIEGWNIYRNDQEYGIFTLIGSLPFTTLSYVDDGLVDGNEYYYVVRSFSNTVDINTSISDVVPNKSILIGEVVTAGGDIVSITPQRTIIKDLENTVEAMTTEYLRNHKHSADIEEEFSDTRNQALKINLSKEEDVTEFTTIDYQVYVSERDLVDYGSSYVVYINDQIPSVLYEVDFDDNTIVFETALYSTEGSGLYEDPPIVRLQFIDLKEISGQLNSRFIEDFNASKIVSGILAKALLPGLSHRGRIKEIAGVRTYALLSDDNIYYDLNNVTYVVDGEERQIELGTPTVFYDFFEYGGNLYGASSAGILKSEDGGITWDSHVSLGDLPRKFYAKQIGDDIVYLALCRRKIYYTKDIDTWFAMGGIDAISSLHGVAEDDTGNLMIATDTGCYYYDLDFASSYKFQASSIITFDSTTTEIVSMISLGGSDILVTTSEGVFYTSNLGNTWSKFSAVSPLYSMVRWSASRILAVNEEGYLVYTDDDGINWSTLENFSGLSRDDIFKVIDGRLFFTTTEGLFYTDDLSTTHEINGEFKRRITKSHVRALYGTSKNDILLSFDNKLYKWKNGSTTLWSEFVGTIPSVYVNGVLVSNGYYYNTLNNDLYFEWKRTYDDVCEIATSYDEYLLPAGGWQDIDTDDVEISAYVNNVYLGTTGSTELEEDNIVLDEDTEEILNKKYEFISGDRKLTIHSVNGRVYITGPEFSKFDIISVSIANVTFTNEGAYTHDEIDDALSKRDVGLPFGLGNTYLDGILQMGLHAEHNFLEYLQTDSQYPYASTHVVRSFNSELINTDHFIFGKYFYDVFNSTIDYDAVAYNKTLDPSPFTIRGFYEINGETWIATDRNIFALSYDRSSIDREIMPDSVDIDVTSIAVIGDSVYVVGSDELYVSDDWGSTWTRNEGYNLPRDLYQIDSIFNVVVVGGLDGVYYASQGSSTWTKGDFYDADAESVVIDKQVSSLVVSRIAYCLIDNVVYKSFNGVTWREAFSFDSLNITGLVADRMFAYNNTFFALTNKGLYNDLGSLSNTVDSVKFSRMEIDVSDSAVSVKDIASINKVILVMAEKNTLYKSIDSGDTWTKQTISVVDFADMCHVWAQIKITSSLITNMNNVGVPTSVTDKLSSILDDVYATETALRSSLQLLLTSVEYNNYADTIIEHASSPYDDTELISALEDVYNRQEDLSFGYLLTTARADRVYENTLKQPVENPGAFQKISVYLSPTEMTGTDYSITLEVYGADGSNNITTGILSSDTKSASEIYGPGWYNFRLYYSGSDDRIMLVMRQNYGDNNNFVKWDHSVPSTGLGAINDAGEQSYTYNYTIWRYEDSSDTVNHRVSSDPAEDFVETPVIGSGDFYQTKYEDSKVKLSLDPKVLSFLIDQSGSQSWNDYYGSRFDLIRQFATDLHNIYPGELYYVLATYGAKIINSLNIELVESGDDDIYGEAFRIVRRTDHYPTTPVDGSIVANTSLTVADDDTVISGSTYYYSIFNMRSDSSYSTPKTAAITVRARNNPLPVAGLKLEEVVVKETIGSPAAEVDTGKRKVVLSFQTIQNYTSYYNAVRIVRKECYRDADLVEDFATIQPTSGTTEPGTGGQIDSHETVDDRIANPYDGTVIYEGAVTSGENIVIDDFGGSYDPINGIKYYYAVYTKNSDGNYCLPQNALQDSITISTVWRAWMYDPTYVPSQIPTEFTVSPSDATDFTVEEGNTQNRISWTLPTGDTAIGVMLFASDDETPDIDPLKIAHLNAEGKTGSLSSTSDSSSTGLASQGHLIYQGTGNYYVHRELENNKIHHYRLYTFDRVRTLSAGAPIGEGIPGSDIVDTFEPPDADNFRIEIFNDEKVILRWDREDYYYETLSYFDEEVAVRSFAYDENGVAIPEIDNFDISVESAMWTTRPVPELYGGGGGEEVSLLRDDYSVINDKSSYDGEIRSTFSLAEASNPSVLSDYRQVTFNVKSEYKIYDEELLSQEEEEPGLTADEAGVDESLYLEGLIGGESEEALAFSVESDQLQFTMLNPLRAFARNKYPDTQKVAQKEMQSDGFGGSSEVVVYYDGVYAKSGMPYYGEVEVQFEREALEDNDIISVSAYVYELDRKERQRDGSYKRIWKQTPSEVFLLESNVVDMANVERQSYVQGKDGEEQRTSRVVTATVGTFKLLPPDQTGELNVFITTTVNGYTEYTEHFLLIKSLLNVDIEVRAPIADGRDVAEQFADVYTGPPKYDGLSKLPRAPVPNGTLVKWELEKGRYGQDRPFYSSESVPLQEGIYSVVRNGIARNIFFGPASDVKAHLVRTQDGGFEIVGEEYTIKASSVYGGMFGKGEEEVEIKPLEETGTSYRFYMTNGYEMAGHTIYADGSTPTNIEIHADPLATGGDGGQTFYDCMDIGDMPYIPLLEGQKIELKDPSLGDIEEAEVIYTYNGTEYTNPDDLDIRISSGRADFSVGINAFVGPPPKEKGSPPEEPQFAKCYFYGLVPPDLGYPPIVDFSGTTQMIFGGNSITMMGGGSRTTGIPPVVTILKEPLNVEFQKMLSRSTVVINPPNDGLNTTDIYFKISFAEDPVPDGTPITFDFVFYNGDEELTTEQLSNLSEEKKRLIFGGFSSYEEFIEEVNLQTYDGITSTVDGESVVYCTLNPTRIKSDLVLYVRATSTYDKRGTVSRVMSGEAKLKITGVDDNEGGTSVYLKKVERYDPVSDTWDEIDPMLVGRVGASCVYDPASEKTIVVSGLTESGISVSGEQFEYARPDKSELNGSYGTWSYIADITYARAFSQSVLYNENIYLMGGFGWNPFSGQSGPNANVLCEAYDINSDSWSILSDMPHPVSHGCAEVIGDNIYVFGGISSLTENDNGHEVDSFNNYLMKYNITSGVWTTIDTLDPNVNALMRISPVSYVKNNKIYVFGGILNQFDPDNYEEALFVNSLVEIDVSDENNITYTIIPYTNSPIQRFRAGAYSLFNDNFYVIGGSGIKQYVDGSVTRTYASNTLRALEIYDTTTDTWTTYRNLSKMTYERHSLGATDDGEYVYAIGGGGSGYDPGKLLITVTLSPEEMRADGKTQVSALVELEDTTGEPPEDGIKILIRGYVLLKLDSNVGATESVVATGLTTEREGTSSAISTAETGSVAEMANRVSIYPVLFSDLTLYSEDGAASTIALERGEDVLVALRDLVQYIDGDDTIIGIKYNEETKSVTVPKKKPLEIKLGERRDLYQIIVEVTIEDDFYFGRTDTERTLASNMSGYLAQGDTGLLPGEMVDPETGKIVKDPDYVDPDERDVASSITAPEEAEQEKSPTIGVFNDITWIPYVNDDYESMEYAEFIDEIDLLEQAVPFGGSPHWDGMVDFCQNSLKDNSIIFVEKFVVDVSDNEENLSENSLTNAIDQVHLVDGYQKLPVFTNMFVTSFPPSLSARKGQADVVDLERLAGETFGLSHTIIDDSFIRPVVRQIKIGSVGAMGRGTYTQVVDFGQQVHIINLKGFFELYQYTNGWVEVEYSSDSYNYTSAGIIFEADTLTELNVSARYVRFVVTLSSEFGNASLVVPVPPPAFLQIQLTYSEPKTQYIYTYSHDLASYIREMYLTLNGDIPMTSDVKLGFTSSNSTIWDDYQKDAQPSVDENGRIVAVNSTMSLLNLSGASSTGGNTSLTYKTYEQIMNEFIQEKQTEYGKVIDSVIILENKTDTDDGSSRILFADSSTITIDEAPDFSNAIDFSTIEGSDPTKYATTGTILNYDFVYSIDGYLFLSRYGRWQPESAVNVYRNGVLVDPTEYTLIRHKGAVKFFERQRLTNNYAIEVGMSPKYRVGIAVTNRDSSSYAILDDFAYIYNTNFVKATDYQNAIPQVTNLYITPLEAKKNSTFTVNYTYMDGNNDVERNSEIQWYINGGVVPELRDKTSWSASDLYKNTLKDGDRIFFTVKPSDGKVFGALTTSKTTYIGDTPPTISGLRLSYVRGATASSTPDSDVSIYVIYTYYDTQGRAESGTSIEWYVDGEAVAFDTNDPSILLNNTLDSEGNKIIARGNVLQAKVRPSNGIIEGDLYETEEIVIQNAAPSVQLVRLTPASPTSTSTLAVSYEFSDPDEDDDSTEIRWFRNGEMVTALNDLKQANASNLTSGDEWYVELTPYDGQDRGTIVRTETVTIS